MQLARSVVASGWRIGMPTNYADWPEEYAQKLLSPADAAALVRPGDAIVIPVGALTPKTMR